MEALKYVLGLLQLVVSGWCYVLYSDYKALRNSHESLIKEVAATRLHTAETYVTKGESTRAYDALTKNLETLSATIMSRLDRIEQKLDNKVDKGDN